MSATVIFGALSGICALLSFLAAEKASGHLPFSGYAEEKLWGGISAAGLIMACVFFGIALFV